MFPDERKYVAAVARISSQMSLEGASQWLPSEIPADKRDVLGKLMNKLVRQITDVGLCVYVGSLKEIDKKFGDAGLPIGVLGESGDDFLNPVVIAKVHDARVFLDGAVDLLKDAERANLIAGDKTKITYHEDEMAGKPTRTIMFEGTDKQRKSSSSGFVLTAIDNQTIFGCLAVPGSVEDMIKKHSKPSEHSLATNAAIKSARALLPEQLQMAVFVDLQKFGFLRNEKKGADDDKRTGLPPLTFSMRVIPAAVEAQFVIPFDAIKAVFDGSVTKVGEAAARTQAMNNMRQLGLAMHSYHDAYLSLPPPAICDKSGKPLLSWRVAILSFVEQQTLYKEFKLDEPWDSEHNKKLLPRMPKVFQMPGRSDADRTYCRVPVGKGAIFSSPSEKMSLAKISDGTSNTIMIVETAESVPWTKPEEFDFGTGPLPKLFSRDGTICVLFADSAIRCLPETVRDAALRAAFTRAGGEKLELPDE